jgi:hypothetical protein
MPDNIRRVDKLIRGVHRITAYDLCSILSIGKVSVMAVFQSLAIPRSFLVWGCECWQMHTKRQEKHSPLIFYAKTTRELRDSYSRLSRGVKTESTILNQNSSGSRWNGVIRYLLGRRNSRVLRQMEGRGYSLSTLLSWCHTIILSPVCCLGGGRAKTSVHQWRGTAERLCSSGWIE